MRRYERGLTTTEFAIISVVLMIVLFALLEMGRTLFVMNTLTEVTRRGARIAAVCPVTNPGYASSVAIFAPGGGSSPVVSGLTPANVVIDYLDQNGALVPDPTTQAVYFTRARLVGFTLNLAIPLVLPSLTMPDFAATVPAESLGYSRAGVLEPCT